MKIIHTSDWHLGMKALSDTYEDCQRYFLDRLYDLIRRENVGAVLCAGDVYDSGHVGADAIALFDQAAGTICGELGVQFIVIAGNHDTPERLAAHRELLKGSGLHITGRLEREIEPVLLDGGKVAVYPVPFFNRYEVIQLFPEYGDQIKTQEDAALVVCSHIRERMDPARKNIVISHSYIVDAELCESDRAAQVGSASAVSKDVFNGFDYAALGHIHKPQAVTEKIRYSGSPLKYSFGKEELQEKGVVLLDTDTMTSSFIPLPELRDHKTVKGTFAEIMARADLRNDYLRLIVTDRYVGLETQAELSEQFPYLLEFKGRQDDDTGEGSSLTMDELEKMDDTVILKKFLMERFEYTPTQEQLDLFIEALSEQEEA